MTDYLTQQPQKYLMDGCKLLWYRDRLNQWVKGNRIMPITVDMGIHKGCNIKCIYCYGVYQKPSSDYIPTDRLLQFAKDCKDCNIKGVAIVGDGEPTMNKGLYPFVEALTDNSVASAVATNGLLLDNQKIDILTRNCSWVRFNVSAIENKYPEIHKGTTIVDFKRLEKLIEYAVEHKEDCTIGLQMVLIPDCLDQIVPFAKWAVRLGVDYAQIKQFSDAGSGMPIHFDMKVYDEAKLLLRQAELLSTNQTKIKVKWKALEDSKNITTSSQWDFHRCLDLPFLFQISGNGKCYPCGYLFNQEKYCYGSVIDDTLKNILQSDRYWDIIRTIAETPLIELCTGQCRHCQSNQFIDRFMKIYNGDTDKTLTELCKSQEQYDRLLSNPPEHLEFI